MDEGTRFYRAFYHAGRWDFATQLKGEYDWEENIEHSEEMLQSLREVLWAKYQRRRTTWKIIASLDKLLEDEYGVTPPQKA